MNRSENNISGIHDSAINTGDHGIATNSTVRGNDRLTSSLQALLNEIDQHQHELEKPALMRETVEEIRQEPDRAKTPLRFLAETGKNVATVTAAVEAVRRALGL